MKSGRKSEAAINEGILKVMADLKIDTNITREVSQSDVSLISGRGEMTWKVL